MLPASLGCTGPARPVVGLSYPDCCTGPAGPIGCTGCTGPVGFYYPDDDFFTNSLYLVGDTGPKGPYQYDLPPPPPPVVPAPVISAYAAPAAALCSKAPSHMSDFVAKKILASSTEDILLE